MAIRLNSIAAGCAALCSAAWYCTASPQIEEYRLKAAYLFHFAQLIEPLTPVPANDRPFFVCTFDGDPFAGGLEELAADKRVGKREVRILHARRIVDTEQCSLIFFAKGERKNASSLLAAIKGKPVITVGETPDFLELGGILSLGIENQKLRFDVNRDAATDSGLKVSSRLLVLARRVIDRSR